MAKEGLAGRLEERKGIGVKVSGVGEASDEERNGGRELEEKEKREKGVGLEETRIGRKCNG